ncbi:MAG: hypothetical protein R3E02_10080 [Blastomonas sp.]
MIELRLTTSRWRYSRAGIAIGSNAVPTILPAAEVRPDAMARLFGDPAIHIRWRVDGGDWRVPSAAERRAVIEAWDALDGDQRAAALAEFDLGNNGEPSAPVSVDGIASAFSGNQEPVRQEPGGASAPPGYEPPAASPEQSRQSTDNGAAHADAPADGEKQPEPSPDAPVAGPDPAAKPAAKKRGGRAASKPEPA